MNKFWTCRRTFVSVLGIMACLVLGLVNHADVANAIAAIAMGLAAANAGQAAMAKKADTNAPTNT